MRCLPLIAAALVTVPLAALDPSKALTQYSSTNWTQEDGLPQDSVRAITQTLDGYLWIGTEDGLARFDGYEFVTFSKDQGQLPSNSIMALAASPDGSLWIGTPAGLARYKDRAFRRYGKKDGLPDDSVTGLYVDSAGALWVVASGNLSRFDGTSFTNYLRERDMPMAAVVSVAEDKQRRLYAVGFNSVARFENGRFVARISMDPGFVPRDLQPDALGNIWVLRTRGLLRYGAGGDSRMYGPRDGLPDGVGFGALQQDRDHNLWIGSGNRLTRVQNGDFATAESMPIGEVDSVRSLFEDREGNLWVGSSNGLMRLRESLFTVYGRAEGLPSDGPSTVYQDSKGTVWIGFADGGVATLTLGPPHRVVKHPEITRNRVFSFHETQDGDLLVAAGDGLMRLKGGRVERFVAPNDALGRKYVYDAFEDEEGRLWIALPSGLAVLKGRDFRIVVPGGPLTEDAISVLARSPDGSIWAGSSKGLWRVRGEEIRRYTMADGLSSNSVRSLFFDTSGRLWIGTYGGGLNMLHGDRFSHIGAKDGLLSDNISKIVSDGTSLWLTTTRGINRVPWGQLDDFLAGVVTALRPASFGAAEGLRSAPYSPTVGSGGGHYADGNLWLVTSRAVVLHQPKVAAQPEKLPPVALTEISSEGRLLDWNKPEVPAGSGRVQIRYAAVTFRSPERIRYSYRLDGLDKDWVQAGIRRGVNYSSLSHGGYVFRVRAEADGAISEAAFPLVVLPHFYETWWFRMAMVTLAGLIAWGAYRMREQRVRSQFAAVLEERARLAREVHDTLAQGFVGLASQLEVVEMCLPKEANVARGALDLARRMTHHSLTEARRSVQDLRAAALDEEDLGAALKSGVQLWTAGSGVEVGVEVAGEAAGLPEDVAHHLLRIAQEAVSNAVKHARAKHIRLKLSRGPQQLELKVTDDGCGFERDGVFTSAQGHFGLLGMRERAERLGGELHLDSQPGKGTQLAISVPLT